MFAYCKDVHQFSILHYCISLSLYRSFHFIYNITCSWFCYSCLVIVSTKVVLSQFLWPMLASGIHSILAGVTLSFEADRCWVPFANWHFGSVTSQEAASQLPSSLPDKPASMAPQCAQFALTCKHLQLNALSFCMILDFI